MKKEILLLEVLTNETGGELCFQLCSVQVQSSCLWQLGHGGPSTCWFSKALKARPERSWLPTTGLLLTSQKANELGELLRQALVPPRSYQGFCGSIPTAISEAVARQG